MGGDEGMGGSDLGKRERGEGMRNGGEGRGGVGACGGSEDGGRGYKAGAGESGYGKGRGREGGRWRGRTVERLKNRIVPPLNGVGVEEKLRGCIPEDLVGWELEEDLCIRRYTYVNNHCSCLHRASKTYPY